jgi:signal transduction histidine kinase
MENEILRIAQEALTNVTRHAQASSASLTLNYEPAQLTLTIIDNGQGFSTSEASLLTAQGHFGVQGMRERARHIGAQLSISSATGQGTQIHLTVPLPTQKGQRNDG